MPPAVAATNVIGEFEQDAKGHGGVPWGRRVSGAAGDSMPVTGPRACGPAGKPQPGSTTAQRIMQANGIKPGKQPQPLKVPPAGGRSRNPKLADVIEESPSPGCCFGFLFGRPSGPSPNPRPGPASDTIPIAPAAAAPAPAPSNRVLTVSSSGRGAPSVMSTSFRQANQSIKRVPQSARSRAASARSRAASAQSRSDRSGTALSNWDDVSDQEYEELEDFIEEDSESLLAERSGMSIREETASFSTAGLAAVAAPGSQSHSHAPSRATSNAIVAYRESAAGVKGVPKSILKSAKREGTQQHLQVADGMSAAGPGVEISGRSRVVLTDGDDAESYSPLYGCKPMYGTSAHPPSAPPGFTSTSVGTSQHRINPSGKALLGPEGGGGAGGSGSDWQLSMAQSGGSGAVLVGGLAGGAPRPGPSSIKLTAEELLGLLMAQGKLTQNDVAELGLSSTAERRGSQGYGSCSSPTSHSPSRFGLGSAGPGGPGVIGGGASPVVAGSQGSGGSQARLQLQLQAAAPAGGDASAATLGTPGLLPPSLAQLRGSEANTSMQQRVRFGASQAPGVSGGSTTGPPAREPLPPGAAPSCLATSSSHRVRFGDDELPAPGGPAAGPGGSASPTIALPTTALPATMSPTAAAVGAGAHSPAYASGPRLGPSAGTQAASCPAVTWHAAGSGGDPSGRTEVLRASSSSVPVAEDSEATRPRAPLQRPVHGRWYPVHGGRRNGPGAEAGAEQGSLDDGSLDLDEVLESAALQLDVGRKTTQPEAAAAAGAATGAAPAAADAVAGSRGAPRPHTEALRLSSPGQSFGGPHRPPCLRSSDSGVMRVAMSGAAVSLGFRGGSAGDVAVIAAGAGGSADGGVGTGRPMRLTSSAQPDPGRPGQTLRLAAAEAVAAAALAPSLSGLSGLSSRPGSACSSSNNNNNAVMPYAPPAPTAAVGDPDAAPAPASVSSCPLATLGSAAAKPRASLLGSGDGGGMGAVDRLAMRKLQSHMNRSNASRCSGEPSNSTPLRQASRSNWIQDNDDERDSGPGTPDRNGGHVDACCRERSLLSGPSVGRSVRFTAPVVFELQQLDGEDSDDDDDDDRAAVAAAARCRASRNSMRCDGLYSSGISCAMDSYRGDRSGAWV